MKLANRYCSLTLCLVPAFVLGSAAKAEVAEHGAPSEGVTRNGEGGLEEIIVTAQRRTERLQSVPISVSAITAAGATARGITQTDDLQNAVPSLTFSRAGPFATPFIRGVGAFTTTQGDDSTVAVYLDDVLQVSAAASIFSLSNIERIEVLKGPQGTLFGRNATGGVISVTTKAPSFEPTLDVRASYGNFDTVEIIGYGATGLSDAAAVDLSVYYRDQSDGWGRNIATGRDEYIGRDLSLRSKLLLNIGESTAVTLSGNYSNSNDQQGVNFRLEQGEIAIDGVTTSPGYYNTANDKRTFIRREKWGANLNVRHSFDGVDLISVSAYNKAKAHWPLDFDFTPSSLLAIDVRQPDRAFTQEVRLLSTDGGPLQWILGGFYLDSNAGYDPTDQRGPIIEAAGIEFARLYSNQKTTSYAGFGQGTIEFLPDTRLTLGARYTSDKRKISGRTDTNFGTGATIENSKVFNKFTYRVSIDHKFSQNVMAYGSISTGFKSGLFNTSVVGGSPVDPENITAYEIGIKSELLDRKLQVNVSAFYYDYKDLQLPQVVLGQVSLLNAAKARIKGVDAEIKAAPTPGLFLDFGLSYIDTEYTEFQNAVEFIHNPVGGRTQIATDATGNRLTRAPKWSANAGAQYEIGKFRLAVNYSYKEKFYWNSANSFVQPAQHLVSGTAAFKINEHYEMSIWGRNLLDEKLLSYGSDTVFGNVGVPAPPRTYGATIRVKL